MSSTTFRFRDLPLEIRNKVYRELLCNFKPRPTLMDPNAMLKFQPARHDIDTAILCTNKTTYLEAHDVMVKTNRFVKVTSISGLHLRSLLCGQFVPVVTSNKKTVDRFKGYVLEVNLACGNPLSPADDSQGMWKPENLMILHRDMDMFCLALADGDAHRPGYSQDLQISLRVAPILGEPQLIMPTIPLRTFFTDITQKTLLAPFRTALRGYKGVKIHGYVDKALAKATQEDMEANRWSDWNKVLADFAAAKQEGSRLFQQRNFEDGCLVWQDAAVEIDTMIESSSWSTLTNRGGERFISQLAELYFLVRLNIAHVKINCMMASFEGAYFQGIMAEDALNSATRSLRQDHWMKGYKYRPSDQHLAKLRYRFALFTRLQGEPGTQDRSLSFIEGALRLQPGDAAILKEKENILAWMARGY